MSGQRRLQTPLPNRPLRGLGAVGLTTLFMLTPLVSPAANHFGNAESRFPRAEGTAFGDPANRLESSVAVLRLSADLVGESIDEAQLARLTDEDRSTGILLTPAAALEFTFTGAPRWIDQVAFATNGVHPGTVQISALTDEGWSPFATGDANAHDLSQILSARAVYAQGLRITVGGDAPIQIVELTAGYSPVDPDHGPTAGVPILHYDWVNSYPGDNDLSKCDNDARGLRDHLPGSWDNGGHGNSDAHEHHYKRDDTGSGCNTDHLDWADLSYFSGHGSQNRDDWYYDEELGSFIFGVEVDDQVACPGDARGSWGNGNCEWHAMSSCKTLTGDTWDYWYEAMDGLHMVLGASSNVNDKNYGKTWAKRMVDSGIFDSAHGVRSSWAYSLDLHNGGGTAVVIAETADNGGDHVWGQGSVSDDAPNNNYYHWWTYDLGIFARENQDPFSVALIRDRARYAQPANASLLPRLTNQGMDVAIDPLLLRAPITQTLPCYNVVPANVNDTYVRSIANAICQSQGVLCGGTIGSSGDGSRNLIVGPYELRVDEATGNYEYVDASQWLAWQTSKPVLPTETAAIALASQIAAQWPGTPQGGVYEGADYAWQGIHEVGGGDDPNSTFPTSIRLKWSRRIGNYEVRGGGGRWSAEIGPNGRIQRVMNTGWHNLVTGGTVSVIDPQTVVDALRTQGWNAAIDGVRTPVDVLTITSLELGYYEPTIDDAASKVCPCYIVSGLIGTGTGAVPVEFCCWADATMPQGKILSPVDGTTVAPGSMVCFVGTASGAAPLSLRWLDETGQEIGTGPNVCAPLDYLSSGDEMNAPDRTIELVVKDGLGRETSSYVHLVLQSQSDAAIAPLGAVLSLAPAAPNPTAYGTTFTYALPTGVGGSRTTLTIHDVNGRAVRTLVDGVQPAARYIVSWDGNDDRGHRAANGTYFARLSVAGEVRSTPVTIVR
ncbi:MAG: hypothetical protein IPK72_25105 [Candidatus Eisenbacteria bacterium]|nr:hypothetical protein [Candidatus Eisenbacteria bacterium]